MQGAKARCGEEISQNIQAASRPSTQPEELLATYAWPGEDPVPRATTQFPSLVTRLRNEPSSIPFRTADFERGRGSGISDFRDFHVLLGGIGSWQATYAWPGEDPVPLATMATYTWQGALGPPLAMRK